MKKHNKFLILLLCISLAFLVSCMDEEKEQTETTDPQTEGVLTQAPVVTEAPATSALPETSAVSTVNTTEAPKTDAPVTTVTEPLVTTALPMTTLPVTSAPVTTAPITTVPVTSAPVTTSVQVEEPSKPSDKYDDEILIEIMYASDEDGNWAGLGKYIVNYELLGDEVEKLVVIRSKLAYDKVYSILNGEETERTLADAYNSFRNGIKVILSGNGVEYTEVDAAGYEILKLK